MGWVTLWGFLSHTSVSRSNNSPSGWASLFHSGCWGSWRHGLTGQRVFRQLQVDKMIPTLNDSIIITENITTKYQLIASHLQVSACQLKQQNMAFSLLCNICYPWHKLNQLPVYLISTKSVLEKMASLGLLGILGTESTVPLFQGKASQFMKYKVLFGPRYSVLILLKPCYMASLTNGWWSCMWQAREAYCDLEMSPRAMEMKDCKISYLQRWNDETNDEKKSLEKTSQRDLRLWWELSGVQEPPRDWNSPA